MGNETSLKFATEEDRQKAITDLGTDPSKESELDRIMNAEIGEPVQGGDKPSTIPAEKPPVDDGLDLEETFTIKRKDLPEKYRKSPGEAFKALGEKDELIGRQTGKIRELISKGTQGAPIDEVSLKRAETAEAELARLRTAGGKETVDTSAEIKEVQADIARIETLQTELDVQAKDEGYYTEEYHTKMLELARLQSKNLISLTKLYGKAQAEIVEARTAAGGINEFITRQRETEERVRAEESLNTWYKEMDSIDEPTLKLSKPAKELVEDFKKWKRDVVLAYYPGRNIDLSTDEGRQLAFEAIHQVEIKNPKLILDMQTIGAKVDPGEDVRKYMAQCELIDYQNGYRKDPTTGQYRRVMVYDSSTNKQVPFLLPSMKAALEQRRLDEGYYAKKNDDAFQKGAESLANAAARRDRGAVELHGGADQGQSTPSQVQAMKVITPGEAGYIDPKEAAMEYRKGNKTLFNQINNALKALDMPENEESSMT
jgi:ribosomal protein L29